MDAKEFTAKMHNVDSSNLAKIGFQKGLGPDGSDVLRVEFQRGHAYHYYPVTEQIFREGLQADSVTEWFNSKIRGNAEIKYEQQ